MKRLSFSLTLILLLMVASVKAVTSASLTASGLNVTVTAVDPKPPVSPFVVETTPWPGAAVRRTATAATVQTPVGILSVQPGGRQRRDYAYPGAWSRKTVLRRGQSIPMRGHDQTQALTVGTRTGSFPGMLVTRRLNIVLPTGRTHSIVSVGNPISVKMTL